MWESIEQFYVHIVTTINDGTNAKNGLHSHCKLQCHNHQTVTCDIKTRPPDYRALPYSIYSTASLAILSSSDVQNKR
jgi:hypothetical protein